MMTAHWKKWGPRTWACAVASGMLAAGACCGWQAGFAQRPLRPSATAPQPVGAAESDPRTGVASASVVVQAGNVREASRGGVRLVGYDDPVYEEAPFTPFNPTLTGVDSRDCPPPSGGEPKWPSARPILWQNVFAQSEYIGPPRAVHVPAYRLRVDDQMLFTYRIDRTVGPRYKINVGDELRVESAVDKDLDRRVEVASDGMIILPYIREIPAANRTVDELRKDLEARFKEYYIEPSITVTPTRMNTRLNDLRSVVDARQGLGGQGIQARVIADGTVWLPAIGEVPAQGLTLSELRQEVNARYKDYVEGLDVTPAIQTRAPRFVYVLGEVGTPQKLTLTGPTTVMMALAEAGGWNPGGNLRQIVIFRRTADWRLIATKLDLQGGLWGKRPTPADDIYLRDSDIVLVPKSPIQIADDFINLFFARGLYGLFPNQGFSVTSTL